MGRAVRLASPIVALGVVLFLLVAVPKLTSTPSRIVGLRLPSDVAVPASYHVVYRVTTGAAVTTEDLWVHRPFESYDATYAGPSVTGSPLSVITSRLGRLYVQSASGTPEVVEPAPAPTTFDIRLDALTGADVQGVVQAQGDHRVAGRSCQMLRTAGSLLSNALSGTPTARDHVDSCVDDAGLLLHERHVNGGHVVFDRVAMSVDTSPPSRGFTTAGTHLAVEQGGGKVVTLAAGSRPPGAMFWELAQPLAGFSLLGRFATVSPTANAHIAGTASPIETGVLDVFVNGPDVVTVDQAVDVGPRASPGQSGVPVDLGPLGQGRLTLSPLGGIIRVDVPNGKGAFLLIRGTVAVPQLIAIGRRLQPQPPGTIVTAPDLTSDGAR